MSTPLLAEYQTSFNNTVNAMLLMDKNRRGQPETSEDYAKFVLDLDVLLAKVESACGIAIIQEALVVAAHRHGDSICLDQKILMRLAKKCMIL